jgi:hypothetical protein
MKALISTIENVVLNNEVIGLRIAQVEPDDKVFPVADTLYWMDCDDNVIAGLFYFDTTQNAILPTPILTGQSSANEPTTTGTTTL